MPAETSANRITFYQLGFRPFFLFAAAFAFISVALWLAMTGFNRHPLAMPQLSPITWHAHEMLYGYALAVIAGFLLTAVRNWTGIHTLHGKPLMILVMLWLLARFMPFVPNPLAVPIMTALDLAFNAGLCLAVLYPIIKARQLQQLVVWIHLVLLLCGNLWFYLGLLDLLDSGVQPGLYTGLYVIISLMLIMGRRVIPMFIQNGVGYPASLTNRRWVDIGCLIVMPIFMVVDIFLHLNPIAAISATLLCLLLSLRMAGWYTRGIWHKPLLWILYLAYGWITLGFAITAAAYSLDFDPRLAVHAFSYGGIALMTLGMMARVALGHTGRDLARTPPGLAWLFAVLFAGSILRIVMPLAAPEGYPAWIAGSQVLWLIAFTAFIAIYTPILIQPRVDGREG